jgi:hypothetical protein
MFAQIGEALQNRKTAAAVLGGLHPAHILAVGESQSAYYLTTFANAIQPMTNAYDGIFIHSRGGGAANFSGTVLSGAKLTGPQDIRVRTDLRVPVFMFETETDLAELNYATAQQPDTAHIRTWEVAGTSHADKFLVGPYQSFLGCTSPVNNGPQHLVLQAAFAALTKWAAHGTPPRRAPRFRMSSIHPATLVRDHDGDVRGGVRTPAVAVPVETLSGTAPADASILCSLFGSSTPFTQAKLAKRYSTPAHYRAMFAASLDQAIARGYLLKSSRATLLADASKVTF